MRTPTLGLALLLGALAAGCAASRPAAQAPQQERAYIDARLEVIEARLDRVERMVEEILVGAKGGRYTVRPGDNAAHIARVFGVTLDQLAAMNPEVRWDHLQVGQVIRVKAEGRPN